MRDDPTRYDNADYEDYLELQRALRALGDEVRLNITRVLAGQGEVNVTDLALRLAVSQPLVSWHVGALVSGEASAALDDVAPADVAGR